MFVNTGSCCSRGEKTSRQSFKNSINKVMSLFNNEVQTRTKRLANLTSHLDSLKRWLSSESDTLAKLANVSLRTCDAYISLLTIAGVNCC